MTQRTNFSILEAPSILGLFPSGVEQLPTALRRAGLHERLQAEDAGSIAAPAFDPQRDPATGLLNPTGIADYSRLLAAAVESILQINRFPIVLGGDCSILLGNLLALRRRGRYGLFFLDGHADFYQPEAEPKGEVASMDLAIATGYGPEILTNLDGLKPLVQEEDVVLFGYRDSELASQAGSQDVTETKIAAYDLNTVRRIGVKSAMIQTLERLQRPEMAGFWVHLDADVLHDEIMPAVDYRMPDGLHFAELTELLQLLMASPKVIGMDITIFNPELDRDGTIASAFVEALVAGLYPQT